MQVNAIIYVPTDTPVSMATSTQKVAGVPLIIRAVMNATNAGIKRCILITAPSQIPKIQKFFRRYRPERLPEIEYIPYDEPYGITPGIIQETLSSGSKLYLLMNANLICEPSAIKQMLAFPIRGKGLVKAKQGITDIPMLLTTGSRLHDLFSFTEKRPRSIESCLSFMLENTQTHELNLDHKARTFLVKSFQDRQVAEKFLAESIRQGMYAPIARIINKRISLPISLVLARLWISPHSVTAVNIVIGLLCGVFLAGGNYRDMLIGAILFKIASIADGCDGENAKLTFRASKFGQYIDTVSDNLALASFLIGLTIGNYKLTGHIWPLIVGAWTIFAATASVLLIARHLKRYTNSASLATFDTGYMRILERKKSIFTTFTSTMKHFVKKDAFAMGTLLFAIPGWFVPLQIVFAVGATGAFLTLFAMQFRKASIPQTATNEKVATCIK